MKKLILKLIPMFILKAIVDFGFNDGYAEVRRRYKIKHGIDENYEPRM
jgi:hypothetical protein